MAKISELVSDKCPDRAARTGHSTLALRGGANDQLINAGRSYGLTSAPLSRAMIRKPSCSISCHWLPDRGFVGFAGGGTAMSPAGKVRCHIRKQIELAAVIATQPNQPHGHDPGGSGAYAIRALPN